MNRAQAARKGGLARAAQFTPEYQQWARGHVSPESCAANGRKGFRATAERHGVERAHERAREYRLAHPSAPEQLLMRRLLDLGLLPGRDYQREYQEPFAGPHGYCLDFAFLTSGKAVEVDGQGRLYSLHPERRGREAQRLRDLEEIGWQVLVLTDEELASPDVTERLVIFLGLESEAFE